MKKNLAFIVEPGGTAVVYDRLMRHWIKTELGVEIPCVRRTIRRRCWGCGKRRKLKKCGGVHINYKYYKTPNQCIALKINFYLFCRMHDFQILLQRVSDLGLGEWRTQACSHNNAGRKGKVDEHKRYIKNRYIWYLKDISNAFLKCYYSFNGIGAPTTLLNLSYPWSLAPAPTQAFISMPELYEFES